MQDRGATIARRVVADRRADPSWATRETREGMVCEEPIREAGVSALEILGRAGSGSPGRLRRPAQTTGLEYWVRTRPSVFCRSAGLAKRKLRLVYSPGMPKSAWQPSWPLGQHGRWGGLMLFP